MYNYAVVMIFNKKRSSSRQVRRYGRNGELLDREGFPAPGLAAQPEIKKSKKWKWLLLGLAIFVLLLAVTVTAFYIYVKATPVRGESGGRINLMVLGVDNTANLSDTIMLVSINTRSPEPQVAMISLPRDLMLTIPEFGESKINAAYSYGQNNAYPGGGPALTQDTIEDNFGIKIHYFVTLDFSGFKQVINTLGGIDIDVKTAIDDPFYPRADYRGYEPFSLAAGQQHLNGEIALKYARSRQTTTDFDRAARQQQIILAVKNKLLSREGLGDLRRIQKLKSILQEHLKSDLSFREVSKIGLILYGLEDQAVTRHVIDTSNFLRPLFPGASGLVPIAGGFSEINAFIQNIFKEKTNNIPDAQL